MKYLNKPIAYLQDSDFDASGSIINSAIPNDKPVVIMIQANFCGHCTNAKPDFQQYAEHIGDKVFCATIQGDGDQPGEAELGKRLSVIKPGFRGYPDYVKYKNGKRVDGDISGRKLEHLIKFGET
jgi:thiol-disulfide isomerase/thioredoxin